MAPLTWIRPPIITSSDKLSDLDKALHMIINMPDKQLGLMLRTDEILKPEPEPVMFICKQ
jgi:hypothetical protein